MAAPFAESRRLTGPSLYLDEPGAALQSAADVVFDGDTLARWRDNIAHARAALDWPRGAVCVRPHAGGVSLALAAPFDQLYTATAVNEWAWCDALGVAVVSDLAPLNGVADRTEALRLLRQAAQAEARPALHALAAAAEQRAVPLLADDEAASLGHGIHGRTWAIDALPAPADVAWSALRAIPTALVTGSNGKTTTVRLLAAMTRAHGWATAYSCTDGVYFDGQVLEAGDFSGPGGARAALRHPQAQAAVLETARGGLLRRGLAVRRADAAVVTNVSDDHFGEYGIHDLDGLAQVKLIVAKAIDAAGLLVLNADDPLLAQISATLDCLVGWFAQDFAHPLLQRNRARGLPACGVGDGRLLLAPAGTQAAGEAIADLGNIAQMPLTLHGRAGYNIANAAAAALAAQALGVPHAAIAQVLATFGSASGDNPGRLQSWRFGDARVVVDYAHNPAGLQGLFDAVDTAQRPARLGILLGHAGNREHSDYVAVANTVAQQRPERVVLKDLSGLERGRAQGEVPQILRQALLQAGVPPAAIATQLDEPAAARELLQWAEAGDLLLLPIHTEAARTRVQALLQRMHQQAWRPGQPVPPLPELDHA